MIGSWPAKYHQTFGAVVVKNEFVTIAAIAMKFQEPIDG
jgi:hypothetical protein